MDESEGSAGGHVRKEALSQVNPSRAPKPLSMGQVSSDKPDPQRNEDTNQLASASSPSKLKVLDRRKAASPLSDGSGVPEPRAQTTPP